MRYRLNFISTTVDRWKRRRIQQFTFLIYLVLILFTIIVFFQLYDSVNYMASVLTEKVQFVRQRIADIEPHVILLENKIETRNKLQNKVDLYTQYNRRPSVWYARLTELNKELPQDIILDKVVFESMPINVQKLTSDFSIEGHYNIKAGDQDIHVVDYYRSTLAESPYYSTTYKSIHFKDNSIYKKENDLILTFTMVFEK